MIEDRTDLCKHMASQLELNDKWASAMVHLNEVRTAYNERWKQIVALRETAQTQLKVVLSAELDLAIIGDDEVRRPILRDAENKWKEAAQKVNEAIRTEATALATAHQTIQKIYEDL